MPQSLTIASAHLKVYVNGQLLGWTSGMAWDVATPTRELRGIDSAVVQEFAPTTYLTQGSFTIIRGRLQGGLEGLGLVAFAQDLTRQKYCTIEVLDRITDEFVFRAIDCVVESQSWRADPKGVVTGTFSWRGRVFGNEASK